MATEHLPYSLSGSGLFSVAEFMPSSEVQWGGSGWGATDSCPSGGLWTCEEEDEEREDPTKALANDPQTYKFTPFNAYQVTGCRSGTSGLEAARIAGLANEHLIMNVEGWVSAGLEIGTGTSPAFVDFTDLTPITGAVTPMLGIVELLRNRAMLGIFDRPIIHLPTWSAPALRLAPYLSAVADICWGPGYNVLLDVPPAANEVWAYITGRVQYSVQGFENFAGDRTLEELRQNVRTSLTEIMVNRRFGPCGNFKVLLRVCE